MRFSVNVGRLLLFLGAYVRMHLVDRVGRKVRHRAFAVIALLYSKTKTPAQCSMWKWTHCQYFTIIFVLPCKFFSLSLGFDHSLGRCHIHGLNWLCCICGDWPFVFRNRFGCYSSYNFSFGHFLWGVRPEKTKDIAHRWSILLDVLLYFSN